MGVERVGAPRVILVGSAVAPLVGGLDGPLGGRIPQPDGFVELADEPFARALVLDDHYQQAALVQVDLFGLDDDTRAAAGELIWEAARIRPERVFFVPTGQMTTPLAMTPPDGRPRPEAYVEYVGRQLASAVILAARGRQAASVGWAAGEAVVGQAGMSLRGPRVFVADRLDGSPLAVAVQWPVLAGESDRVMSAGGPGAFAETIARLGPSCGAVALLGPAVGVEPTLWAPRLYGEQLAGLAWAASVGGETAADLVLRSAATTVELPLELAAADEAEARLERAEARLEGPTDPLYRRAAEAERGRALAALEAVERGAATIEVELTALAVGDGAWLLTPLLVSPSVAWQLESSPFAQRLQVISGANGVRGVLTDERLPLPVETGWYMPAPFAPAAADAWLAAARALVDQVAEAREEPAAPRAIDGRLQGNKNGEPDSPGEG